MKTNIIRKCYCMLRSSIHFYRIPILTSSGKLDKRALPPIDKQEAVDKEGLPSTETERKLMKLWAEALQLDSVDVQESFFDLGGLETKNLCFLASEMKH